MKKSIPLLALFLISQSVAPAQTSDKQRAGLSGPVKSVREETAKLRNKDGQVTEGPRVLMQALTFDEHGSIVIKGSYTYEFDGVGNWIKRKTVRETIRDKSTEIEMELTYRTIIYY